MSAIQVFESLYGTDINVSGILHSLLEKEGLAQKLIDDIDNNTWGIFKERTLWQLIQANPVYYEPVVRHLLSSKKSISPLMFKAILPHYQNLLNELFAYLDKYPKLLKGRETPFILIKNTKKINFQLSEKQTDIIFNQIKNNYWFRISEVIEVNDLLYFLKQWLAYRATAADFAEALNYLKSYGKPVTISQEIDLLSCASKKTIIDVWHKSKNKTKQAAYARHFPEIKKLLPLV